MASSGFTYRDNEYKEYTFVITSLFEFINEYCVRNNEVADQTVLNRAVLQLKKEFQQVLGQIKVLTTQPAPLWSSLIKYEPGEIVSYFANGLATGHTEDEIADSFYMALPAKDDNGDAVTNKGIVPPQNTELWGKITLNDLYPKLDLKNYPQKNRETQDWDTVNPETQTENPYTVVNISKLTQKLKEIEDTLKTFVSENYPSKTNTTDYLSDITNSNKNLAQNKFKPATLNYVENRVASVENSLSNLDDQLGDYVKLSSDGTNKMTSSREDSKNSTYSFATPNGGLVPGVSGTSNLGSVNQKFNYVYANIFQGIATKALYADLAEIVESEKTFPAGTVLSMSQIDGDLKEYEAGDELFGVVSENPGFVLNSEAKGVLIAHKGQVKVLVRGPVKKGEIIIAVDEGVAEAVSRLSQVVRHLKIGIALESNDSKETKLINTMVQ